VDRVLPVLVILLILAVVFGGMALGWRSRRRRQVDFPKLAAPPPALGSITLADDVLYVATTRASAPLDRIAVSGLGFRARARVEVGPSGIVLGLAGRPPAFIPARDVRGAGRATWTIDRVVGKDRLVFFRWAFGDRDVDSYMRSNDPASLVNAINALTVPVVKESSS
jgi:hypothetical protein